MKRREHEKSSVRAKVEHLFAVVKEQLRYRKTRYRGLRKQTAKLNMLFALANLILADRHFPSGGLIRCTYQCGYSKVQRLFCSTTDYQRSSSAIMRCCLKFETYDEVGST